MDEKKIEEMSYQEASDELEAIVRELEGGELELEEALERYSRGVNLLSSLRERLADAEQKVKVLLDTSNASTEQLGSLDDSVSAPSDLPF